MCAAVIGLTGASDFLGVALIERLERDPEVDRVVALDVRIPKVQATKLRYERIDLTEPGADRQLSEILSREGVEALAHLAFLTNPTHNSTWAHELELIGTIYVLQAAAATGLRRLVVRSHTCVYGALASNPSLLTETHPLHGNPRSRFVSDKVEAERETARFSAQHPRTRVTILRTCSIVGPRVDTYLTRYFRRRVIPTLMGFDPLLQFVHVDDVIEALFIALHGEASGPFNIVGKGLLSLSNAVRLAGATSVPIPHVFLYPAIHALWTAQAVEAPSAFLDYLRYVWAADGARAREALGFEPKYSSRRAFRSLFPEAKEGAA